MAYDRLVFQQNSDLKRKGDRQIILDRPFLLVVFEHGVNHVT
jgi:hypothetical protein